MRARWTLSACALALLAGPALASSTSVYPTYWNSDQAGGSFGGGFTAAWGRSAGLELRGAYCEELTDEPFGRLFEGDTPFENGLRAIPLDVDLGAVWRW